MYVEIEFEHQGETIKHNLTPMMIDVLATVCLDQAGYQVVNINPDPKPDPASIRALTWRQLVTQDDVLIYPTEQGLKVCQIVDHLFGEGKRLSGLKDTGLIQRARRLEKEIIMQCSLCGVMRDESNDKHWRKTMCNPCYSREQYLQRKRKNNPDREKTLNSLGIEAEGDEAYDNGTDGTKPRARFGTWLYEDELSLFLALEAVTEIKRGEMIKRWIKQAAKDLIASRDDELTMEGLLQTGRQLLAHSGKRVESYREEKKRVGKSQRKRKKRKAKKNRSKKDQK